MKFVPYGIMEFVLNTEEIRMGMTDGSQDI